VAGLRAEWRCAAVLLDCSCKEVALLLASEPLPSGTTKPFQHSGRYERGRDERLVLSVTKQTA
jgi:hypothetical protein